MENILIQYINKILQDTEFDEGVELDTDLLGSGILDSLGMVQFIAFVEQEFDIKVKPEDMVIENFMTLNHVVSFLEQQ